MRAFLPGVEVLQVHVAFACAGSPNLPLPRFDEETWNTFLKNGGGQFMKFQRCAAGKLTRRL